MDVPILNLYYLLLYAWQRLEEAETVKISAADATSLLDLFARVLVAGTRRLLKKGLDRDYLAHRDQLHGIRGRIDFATTIKRNLAANAMLACEFDDLSRDVLHNQILKATIRRLASQQAVDPVQRQSLADIYRRLSGISELRLAKQHFGRVRLHRNNRFYGFLLDLCELIFDFYIVQETAGEISFKDFVRNEMPRLFEDFVCNFYKIELEGEVPGFKVRGAEEIAWLATGFQGNAEALMPKMRTDISIQTPTRYIVIDTKFYRKTMAKRYDPKLHSSHLYQMFAYLKNIAGKGPWYRHAAGILLYPTVTENLHAGFEIENHWIFLRTVNLNVEWRKIEQQLLDMIFDIVNEFELERVEFVSA